MNVSEDCHVKVQIQMLNPYALNNKCAFITISDFTNGPICFQICCVTLYRASSVSMEVTYKQKIAKSLFQEMLREIIFRLVGKKAILWQTNGKLLRLSVITCFLYLLMRCETLMYFKL